MKLNKKIIYSKDLTNIVKIVIKIIILPELNNVNYNSLFIDNFLPNDTAADSQL